LLVTTGSALNRLAAGTNGHQLTADSAATNGVKWALSPETDLVTTKGDLLVATAADTLARQGVGANGSVLMADSAVTNGLQWNSQSMSNRNVVINGGMQIWQRGTSFTGTSPYYTCDRWQGYRASAAAGGTWSQQVPPSTSVAQNFNYALRTQRDSGNSGTGATYISTSFETINVLPLRGKTLTLSFYARCGANYSPTSSALSCAVYTGTGTDGNIAGGFTGLAALIDSPATLTTTYQRFTFTSSSALGTSITQLGVAFYMTPTGTASTNDWFEITGVQVEAGSVATPFETEDISTTLAKCQRYYQKSYSLETAPATSGALPGLNFAGSYTDSSNNHSLGFISFKVLMRAAPTVTIYGYSPATAGVVSNVQGTNLAALSGTPVQINEKSAIIANGSGGSISPNLGGYLFHFVASAEL
jgi:hypothetical protein